MNSAKLFALVFFLLPVSAAWAQSGKIAGTAVDAETGQPLPGVNVVLLENGEPTTQGAQTDVEGFYTILNVSPGTYSLRASFIGYTPEVRQGVSVNIDLTTEVNFTLQVATVGIDEIVVAAEQPVVQTDVSANVANLSAERIENLPVASIDQVVGLQAGIEPGMRVRGSDLDEVSMMVDGLSMRDGRNNTPFAGISYTSIKEVQVQTGGFNAEYGNVRSGLINVVMKEGPIDRYTADVLLRYNAPSKKYFGILPNDPTAFWMRPYLDPDVAFVGTENGTWDPYLQRQYPAWEGWNSIAQRLSSDDDPNNDLTPEQLQEVFLWQHRKDVRVRKPDYVVDAGIGGPVPLISRPLGDLRFFASYRQDQSAYIIPQVRDTYLNRTGQFKLTSNIARGMKLQFQGLYNMETGLDATMEGGGQIHRGERPAYPWDLRGTIMATRFGDNASIDAAGFDDGRGGDEIFANDTFSKLDITRIGIGGTFTHSLNSNTFYEARLNRMYTDYFSRPGAYRDTTIIKRVGNLGLDETPFGWPDYAIFSDTGMRMGATWATSRDTSWAIVWSGNVSITSQVNRYLQLKGGADFNHTTHRSNHKRSNPPYPHRAQPTYIWNRTSMQGAGFVQSKLEFQGMIANVGLRLDYFDAGGAWYLYDTYDRVFSAAYGKDSLEVLQKASINPQYTLSPRLGVSFPITEVSKLYFNYGHFRQMLNPNSIYIVRTINTGAIDRIGNPNHPMPRTVAYELGYEHSLFNRFLIRMAGYYKDVTDQPRTTSFENITGDVDYGISLPYNYSDTRGFEIELSKNRGWYRGFVNYTYMARKSGNFGFSTYYENPVEQREFERESRAHYQQKPVPEPYARFNFELIAPETFGPEVLGTHPLAGWRLSLLGDWRSGDVFTWRGRSGGAYPNLQNNVRWKNHLNFDMRLTKNFETSIGEVQFFADASNVFNRRQLFRTAAFIGRFDFESYMESLHLPEEVFEDIEGTPYDFIPGNDRPGDYRKPGTPFVPIEIVSNVNDVGNPSTRPLYYVRQEGQMDGGQYMWYRDGSFQPADENFVDEVLKNKQYIDMPNQRAFTFLNPRLISFGFRITL